MTKRMIHTKTVRAIVMMFITIGLFGLNAAAMPETAEAASSFPSGKFQIQATGHNVCVDIPGNNAYGGADLQMYRCNQTAAQTFTYSNGRVINPASGLCLDVEGNGGAGANTQVSTCVGKDSRWNNAQAWKVHGRDLAVPGGRCLDVAGPHSAVSSGKSVVTNQCGYPAKNFKLVPISSSNEDRTSSSLRQGDRGHAVGDLQRDLNRHGFRVSVDKMFGPATTRAVKAFQRSRGLGPDGIVGPATQAALDKPAKVVSPPAPPRTPSAKLGTYECGSRLLNQVEVVATKQTTDDGVTYPRYLVEPSRWGRTFFMPVLPLNAHPDSFAPITQAFFDCVPDESRPAELINSGATFEGLHYQLACHPASVKARGKDTWNLESWRPHVGWARLVAAKCNPT